MTGERKCHPACQLLPEMTEHEYRELVEDIRVLGQRHPIIVDEDDVILDGRHRDRACDELGIEPKVETFHGTEAEKVGLIISENIQRRHLTTQQRAAFAADLANLEHGGDRRSEDFKGQNCPLNTEPISIAEAARVAGVPKSAVKTAKARKRRDPEAHAMAKTGTLPRKPRTTTGATKPKQAKGTTGVEGEDYQLVKDQWGFVHREPVTHPDNVDWQPPPPPAHPLKAVRIAVLHALLVGYSDEEVRTAVSDAFNEHGGPIIENDTVTVTDQPSEGEKLECDECGEPVLEADA